MIDLGSTQDEKKKTAFAKKLVDQSQSIAGTLAERYLKKQRSIDMKKYPDDIRFHPNLYSKLNNVIYSAMLVIARNREGKIKAVQATYLDPQTANKVDKSQVTVQKQMFGIMKGAAVTIKRKKVAPNLIAEGIETGLSLKKAIPQATINVTLSQSNVSGKLTPHLKRKSIGLILIVF